MENESPGPRGVLNEESFHQVLDAIGDMILVKGPGSRILWANRAFCDCYGMSTEKLRGLIDAPYIAPDQTLSYVQDDQRVFDTGKPLDIPEEPITSPTGATWIVHTVKTPIFGRNGRVAMTVGVSRDISERKRVHQELEEQRARALFSSRMATLGEMAGGVAHEINSPLAAIQLLASQLRELVDEGAEDRELIASVSREIEATVSRIAKIVAGVLAISRNGSKDETEILDLRRVVEDAVMICRTRFARVGVELRVQVPTEAVELEGNATQLAQVLLNLLNNACDAVADGASKWVCIEARDRGESLEISVTDGGSGLPPEVLRQVFTSFFTTKGVGKGTGIGLSISKRIVENYGGTLTVDGAHPNTRFVVRLPKRPVAT